MIELIWPYLTVCGAAFLAASILPFSSELVLAGHIASGVAPKWALVGAATVGNVAGAMLNWWLGRELRRFEGTRWFPFSRESIAAASERFNRWGVWVLLLSWVPVIGDPLTLVAGVLRVPMRVFFPLVLIGKAARYVVLAVAL